MTWKNCVCMLTPVPSALDPHAVIKEVSPSKLSSIDKFYEATSPVLVSIGPAYFSTHPKEINNLIFVALITATENYFRDILGFIIQICPTSKSASADERVQLGSFLWGVKDFHSRTAFEFVAFSASKNIRDTVNKFTGHQIKQTGVWSRMLVEFDKLCEIRHAIVHSGHIVAGKNALKLDLKKTDKLMHVAVDYSQVQHAGSICTSLVQAANNELFEVMIERWAVDWRKLGSWDSSRAEELFGKIWSNFLSTRDYANGSISLKLSKKKALTHIKASFGI